MFRKVLILHYIYDQTRSLTVRLQRGQQSSGLFIDHVNNVLDVPKIESKQATSMIHCLHECVQNRRCFSTADIMVGRDKNGVLTCQLLPTDKFNASDSFRPKQFCHFSLVIRNRLQCTF